MIGQQIDGQLHERNLILDAGIVHRDGVARRQSDLPMSVARCEIIQSSYQPHDTLSFVDGEYAPPFFPCAVMRTTALHVSEEISPLHKRKSPDRAGLGDQTKVGLTRWAIPGGD